MNRAEKLAEETFPEHRRTLVDLLHFRKTVVKPFYEALEAAIQACIEKDGMVQAIPQEGGAIKYVQAFQDPNGVVYQIEPCKGRYVVFPDFEVVNTRTVGESQGLAAKWPKALGMEPKLDVEMDYDITPEVLTERLSGAFYQKVDVEIG